MDADVNGLFHVTSEGHCTWYELATTFLDEMEVSNAFAPCTTRDYPTSAERPSNSILENQRLKDEGLNIMRHWRADLIQFVNLFKDRLIEEVK
jgi:dTDP-4-dehydrorhamnose reductase